VYEYYDGSNRKNELRLLLYAYETSLEGEQEDIPFDMKRVVDNRNDKFSIEHVWPQTPSDEVDDKKSRIEEHKHRLGNLTLMTQEDNSGNQNDPFQQKKDAFDGSKFRMLEEVFEEDEWNEEIIEEREKEMIARIKKRWPDEYEESE
ncbi:MAG: HNH endonuclease family protein, partial [Candidatus Aenigmatarchaeota archaeon]